MKDERSVHLTFSYATVSNAAGGQSGKGRGAGVRGCSAARMISYITGEDLQDPKLKSRVITDRADVEEIGMWNWTWGSRKPQPTHLQNLVNVVQERDGRANSKQGVRIIATLPYNADESWDAALKTRMDEARSRVARMLVDELAEKTDAAWVYAIHRDPQGHNGQYHMHAYGTRRQVRRDAKGNVVSLSHYDVDPFASPGRVTQFIQEMRPKHAQMLNRTSAGAWDRVPGEHKTYEYRSLAQIAEDESRERAEQGLPPLEPLLAQRHEGPAATRYRRTLKKAEGYEKSGLRKDAEQLRKEAERIHIGPRSRAAMDHNDGLQAANREIMLRNRQIKESDKAVRELRTLLQDVTPGDISRISRIRHLHVALPAHVQAWVADVEPRGMQIAMPNPGLTISRDGLGRGRGRGDEGGLSR